MKKQINWEKVWARVAVGLLVIAMGGAVWLAISNIDLTPHQILTFEGVQYDCKFPAPDVMECEQVGDPDVGFGKTNP